MVVPRFGARLKALRKAVKIGNKARSQEYVTNRLAARYGLPLDRSTLSEYEKGTVMAPDAGTLWGLAQIYDVSVATLAECLVAERSGGKMAMPEVIAGVHAASLSSSKDPGVIPPRTPTASQEAGMPELGVFNVLIGAWEMVPLHRRNFFAQQVVNLAASLAGGEEEAIPDATGTDPKN